MRPMLRPGLCWAWRSSETLQLGIDDPHPVVLAGLPREGRAMLDLMDGVRTREGLLTELARVTAVSSVAHVETMIDTLVELGAVVDGGAWPGGPRISSETRARLLPDLAAGPVNGNDHWWKALARTHVTVVGASRLGAIITGALASAGVGRLTVHDQHPVTLGDVWHGGFAPEDVGKPRSELLIRHPEWLAMSSRITARRRLFVVTDAVDQEARSRALSAEGFPHLAVSCRERIGRVGPFVVPGRTPCAFCIHLSRRDHDPGWPEVWRQSSWSSTPVAHGPTLSITAHTAVAHVLSWVAADDPPSMSHLVEIEAPHGKTSVRPTRTHPECGCAWPSMSA